MASYESVLVQFHNWTSHTLTLSSKSAPSNDVHYIESPPTTIKPMKFGNAEIRGATPDIGWWATSGTYGEIEYEISDAHDSKFSFKWSVPAMSSDNSFSTIGPTPNFIGQYALSYVWINKKDTSHPTVLVNLIELEEFIALEFYNQTGQTLSYTGATPNSVFFVGSPPTQIPNGETGSLKIKVTGQEGSITYTIDDSSGTPITFSWSVTNIGSAGSAFDTKISGSLAGNYAVVQEKPQWNGNDRKEGLSAYVRIYAQLASS